MEKFNEISSDEEEVSSRERSLTIIPEKFKIEIY